MRKKMSSEFIGKDLTKGQMRKLNALRKSLGNDIADAAFAKWLAAQEGKQGPSESVDRNAAIIEETLTSLIDKGLRIPRGGYHLRRGRGRVILERPMQD